MCVCVHAYLYINVYLLACQPSQPAVRAQRSNNSTANNKNNNNNNNNNVWQQPTASAAAGCIFIKNEKWRAINHCPGGCFIALATLQRIPVLLLLLLTCLRLLLLFARNSIGREIFHCEHAQTSFRRCCLLLILLPAAVVVTVVAVAVLPFHGSCCKLYSVRNKCIEIHYVDWYYLPLVFRISKMGAAWLDAGRCWRWAQHFTVVYTYIF